jgi:hypothetical protein
MKRPTRSVLIASALLLTACTSADTRPVISFIGIATGTLVTELNDLQFNSMFDRDERNLVAVVGFEHVQEGTVVQATWFSPDDRRMPLGRTSIITQSGAKIARFSFASKDPWAAAPYMLQVDAFGSEGTDIGTATGSVSFFIGMNDAEIATYRREYGEWLRVETENRQAWEAEQARFQQLLGVIRRRENFEHSTVLLRNDLTGDRLEDYVIADIPEDLPPTTAPGVLLSATVGRFVMVNNSGVTLFSLNDEGRKRLAVSGDTTLTDVLPQTETIQLTILPSFGISLYWPVDEQVCFAEFNPVDGGYELSREGCRES